MGKEFLLWFSRAWSIHWAIKILCWRGDYNVKFPWGNYGAVLIPQARLGRLLCFLPFYSVEPSSWIRSLLKPHQIFPLRGVQVPQDLFSCWVMRAVLWHQIHTKFFNPALTRIALQWRGIISAINFFKGSYLSFAPGYYYLVYLFLVKNPTGESRVW